MKWLLIAIISIWVSSLSADSSRTISMNQTTNCIECHQKSFMEYQRSQMAVAAKTENFLGEWTRKKKPDDCLYCHSPSRSKGIVCIDCHGINNHPYPKVNVVQICGKCHDAPGEITVQSFLHSGSSRRGEDCLDCHLNLKKRGHEFIGPSTIGFLDNVAKLRVSIRKGPENNTAIINIRHTAGHALPGGTTGRSVWLVIDKLSEQQALIETTKYRFGWFYDNEIGWVNKTILPGMGKVVELSLEKHKKIKRLRAQLIYRFTPGYLSKYDPKQVILAKLDVKIE